MQTKTISTQKGFQLQSTLLILFLILSSVLMAQVQYTDRVPNEEFWASNRMAIDINNDNVHDFILSFRFKTAHSLSDYSGQLMIQSLNGNQVAVENDSAAAFADNSEIHAVLNWSGDSVVKIQYVSTESNVDIGNWLGIKTGYLGVRIKSDNDYHYGWIRLYRNSMISTFLLDYALEQSVGVSIMAGHGIPNLATSLSAQSIANNGLPSDINITATRAIADSIFYEYRMIIAKADDSSASSLTEMLSVADSCYRQVTVDALTNEELFSIQLDTSVLDKDGEKLVSNINYVAHLLNMGKNAANHVLSVPSKPFNIGKKLERARNVSAIDVDDNQQISDVLVKFNVDTIIGNSYTYRIYYGLPKDMDEFTVTSALALDQNHYTSLLTDNLNPSGFLISGQKDIMGNDFVPGSLYKVRVLNFASENSEMLSVLSETSRAFFISESETFTAGQKEGNFVSYYEWDQVFSERNYWTSNSNDYYYPLDVNRDGESDFFAVGARKYLMSIIPIHENEVMIHADYIQEKWLDVLAEGEKISDDNVWTSGKAILLFYSLSFRDITHSGLIPTDYDNTDFYIALRIKKSDSWQYAWLRLQGEGTFLYYVENGIYDQMTGNQEINANKTRLSISPNPASDNIQITSGDLNFSNTKVLVYNVLGQQIDHFSLVSDSYTYPVNNLEKGMYYLVLVQDGSRTESHKFLVE
jgi:hypothetical protein